MLYLLTGVFPGFFFSASCFWEFYMAKAIWNGVILAESDDIEIVEGNYYFPDQAIHKDFFQASITETFCHWKGTASYYNIVVNGETNKDAAWYYQEPYEKAKHIKNRVAFWKGVQIIE